MRITINYKLDNWNDTISKSRTNKGYANRHKQKEMKIVGEYLKDMEPIKEYPIEITFYWHIKSKISDLDNKSVKCILDEMQKLGIIENDNIKYIKRITYEAIYDEEDYVEMEVKKYEPL